MTACTYLAGRLARASSILHDQQQQRYMKTRKSRELRTGSLGSVKGPRTPERGRGLCGEFADVARGPTHAGSNRSALLTVFCRETGAMSAAAHRFLNMPETNTACGHSRGDTEVKG